MAIGWKSNKDCPLCRASLQGEPDGPVLPTAVFPGLGKVYGDFLSDDDPLQAFSGKKVHRACLDAWPLRPRFVGAYLDWMFRRLREDPERGTAYADAATFVSAPCDPADPDAQIFVLNLATGATSRVRNADWPAWVAALPASSPLRARHPTAASLVEAIDWRSKDTTCRICLKLLGINPVSRAAFRLPVSEAWTILDPARPMRQYLGCLAHEECYATWPKRPLFAATLTDIRFRLSKLTASGCPWSDARAILLLDRGGDVELTLRSSGTTVTVPRGGWAAFEPPAELRDFDREPLAAVLADARARFPTEESMEAAVPWAEREEEAARARKLFLEQLRELPVRARREGVRCPRCGRRVSDLELSEEEGAVGCVSCGAALTPLDFGWLP